MSDILAGLAALFARRASAFDDARATMRCFIGALSRLDRPLPTPPHAHGGRVRALGPLFAPRRRP